MKRLLSIAAATAALALAAPAFAQTTGTIQVTGTVPASCNVVATSGGGPAGTWGQISLGTLDGPAPSLTLNPSLTGSTLSGVAPATAQLSCNGGPSTTVSLVANGPLTLAGGLAETGYAYQINYTAQLVANLAGGGSKTLTYLTTSGATPASGTLGDLLANNGSNNLTISVNTLATAGGNSNILEAGTYNSTLTVTVTPQ